MPPEDHSQGTTLAKLIANSNAGDPLKLWDWAVTINKGEVLELDESDFETLVKFIKDNQQLTILSKAQLLRTMLDARNPRAG